MIFYKHLKNRLVKAFLQRKEAFLEIKKLSILIIKLNVYLPKSLTKSIIIYKDLSFLFALPE